MSNKENRQGSSIPSPYNFVPLSDTVLEPDWVKHVSHDLPFEDGLSGELCLEMEAMSPLYVRNGGAWTGEDRKNDQSPMHDFFAAIVGDSNKARYMIPGSSIKGVLRNVLEIATFSKMSRIADNRYSIRNLFSNIYTSKLTSKKGKRVTPLTQAGWLIEDKDKWYVIPCDYARVEHTVIKGVNKQFPTGRCKAKDKYNKFGTSLEVKFDEPPKDWHPHQRGRIDIEYRKIECITEGEVEGVLVFTGQPGSAKHMEFVFYKEKHSRIDVTALKKDFEFIHSDPVSGKPNDEWSYWIKKLHRGSRVPVFYLTADKNEATDSNPPTSMGLAMMYRLPYELSIGQAARNTSEKHFPLDKKDYVIDFADTLFGFVNGKNALKGRVQVGHFKLQADQKSGEGIQENRETWKTVLGSPKPTFFPNYLKQASRQGHLSSGDYTTYMDSNAKLRGWKRYPVRGADNQPSINSLPRVPNDNQDIAVRFRPLEAGSMFGGKIRFHNLKPVELGALLWVISFGGNGNRHHQVGMAKPLGLGRVRFKVNFEKSRIVHPQESSVPYSELMEQFKSYMEESLDQKWEKSVQLQSLLLMADCNNHNKNIKLEYPDLSRKEFIDHFKSKRVLSDYLEFNEGKDSPVVRTQTFQRDNAVSSSSKNVSQMADKEIMDLLSSARQISPKNLRKKLNTLESISSENYETLLSNLEKRKDWNSRSYLKDQYNWYEALEKLRNRIEY